MTNDKATADAQGDAEQIEAVPLGVSLILFDGVCNLCNGVVRWVFARDPAARFRFAPLQGDLARGLLRRYGVDTTVDSIVLVEDNAVFLHSDAVLRIARGLRFPWSLAGSMVVFPRPLRDLVYRWVARTRYRIWGKKDVCPMPPPGLRERFLDLG